LISGNSQGISTKEMLQKIKEYGSFDPTEATWEDQDMVQVQFPEFFLGDKEDVRGEG
jgi:hypothetical protein